MTKHALISVSDKHGIVPFAKFLTNAGFKLISTGGSAAILKEAGLDVIEVANYTGLPEMLDGRVKTLHPKIHGGLLAERTNPEHMACIKALSIPTIDFLIVNLYPFQKTISCSNCSLEKAIANIDIGGPALLRAAAKNYKHVTVLVDPNDYAKIMDEMQHEQYTTKIETRFELAYKVLQHTAEYDALIAGYFRTINTRKTLTYDLPETITISLKKNQDLRYGENPHQKAALYLNSLSQSSDELINYKQIQGKPLSYNNIVDADAAWSCLSNLHDEKNSQQIICTIVKHTNPCGIAIAENATAAYNNAVSCDPISAFGGIIAFNCVLDQSIAQQLSEKFFEVIIAPSFSTEALKIFAKKTNLRLLNIPHIERNNPQDFLIKRVGIGLLVQTPDTLKIQPEECQLVSKRTISNIELVDALFAWNAIKYIKSNAIVFVRNKQTLAIGAGQMSRLDAAKIAVEKAKTLGINLKNSVVASDAFFPFSDGIKVIAEAGATCIIQPGGSKRDNDVIKAANDANISMLFTGIRHFSH